MISFDDKVLVLSGAAGGIGRAIATLFHRLGARLMLSDVDGAALGSLASSLDTQGERVQTMLHDVRDAAATAALAARVAEVFGACDIVVPGAGLFPRQDVESMSDSQWDQVIAINQTGVFLTCRALIPLMRPGGAIVTLASLAGHRGSKGRAHYAAAKGAVLAFTRALASELAPRGIRANAVSPGLIDTGMIDDLMAEKGPALLAATPLQRLGTAEEVAQAVAFLASDAASFVTGETLHVNGGLYMHS